MPTEIQLQGHHNIILTCSTGEPVNFILSFRVKFKSTQGPKLYHKTFGGHPSACTLSDGNVHSVWTLFLGINLLNKVVVK